MATKAAKKKTQIELPKPGQIVRIKAPRDGYRRAGVAHTKAAKEHAHDAFDRDQLEQLWGDENIAISYVDKAKD